MGHTYLLLNFRQWPGKSWSGSMGWWRQSWFWRHPWFFSNHFCGVCWRYFIKVAADISVVFTRIAFYSWCCCHHFAEFFSHLLYIIGSFYSFTQKHSIKFTKVPISTGKESRILSTIFQDICCMYKMLVAVYLWRVYIILWYCLCKQMLLKERIPRYSTM